MESLETLREVQIPELKTRLQDTMAMRRTRYERLMEQHAQMKREERIRYIKDILVIAASLSLLIALIAQYVSHKNEK